MKSLLFFILFLFSINTSCVSQIIKSIAFESPYAIYKKIAWVKEDRFAIISDKDIAGSHFVSVIDTSGKIIRTTKKINTKYSSQHDYVLSLNYAIFFFKHTKDEYGNHKFFISDFTGEDGVLRNPNNNMFLIKETEERKKLNSSAYNFRVYKGLDLNQALVTYNNDYKDAIHEGFRYRILDHMGNVSDELTFDLPYTDRECNIDYVDFDDRNGKIYLVCDLFTFNNKKDREFKNSFIARYDLQTKTYEEISKDVPPFYENKILALPEEKKLVFGGLYPAEKSLTEWTFSFLKIDKEGFKIEDHQYINLQKQTVQKFFDENKKIESEFVQPMNLLEIKNGIYSVSWNYLFQLDQYTDATNSDERNALISAMGVTFGLVGALVTAAATSGNKISGFNKSIWLQYDSNEKKITENVLMSDLNVRLYNLISFGAFKYNQSLWGIMNRAVPDDKNFLVPCVFDYNDSTLTADSKFSSVFLNKRINLLYPASIFTSKSKQYFLGAYDPGNEPSNVKSHNNVYTNILIEIE